MTFSPASYIFIVQNQEPAKGSSHMPDSLEYFTAYCSQELPTNAGRENLLTCKMTNYSLLFFDIQSKNE